MSLANAILFESVDTVKRYLDSGADVNETDEYGFTPLTEAAIANKPDVAQLLLRYGAIVDEPDLANRTPLHWASENNNFELCKLLLDHNADPNARSKDNQPPLVSPILRNQEKLKNLLYKYGASLDYAQDYINAKLIGHRFELQGHAYIATPKNEFALLDFEGFYLEFSLDIIQDSLERYINNFTAKTYKHLFPYINHIIQALSEAAELIAYQQYTVDLKQHRQRINYLCSTNFMIIPTVYQGHAITFVRVGEYLAKCDRGVNSVKEGSVNIYQMRKPKNLTIDLIKDLIYEIRDDNFIHSQINNVLGCEKIMNLPIGAQVTGNCSWANVEAAIPTMLFLMLEMERTPDPKVNEAIFDAVEFFHAWREWDKDRALYDCLQSFNEDSFQRNASKATILASVLFQACRYTDDKGIERAEKIMKILHRKDYRPFIENYVKVYFNDKWTAAGENLDHLFDIIAPDD